MVTFDLSDVLKDSKLTESSALLADVSHKLSIQTSEYVSNIPNLIQGIIPTDCPSSDIAAQTIKSQLMGVHDCMNTSIMHICYDNIWQLLIAEGIIPIASISTKLPNPRELYKDLYSSWNSILVGNFQTGPLYKYMTAFGLVERNLKHHNHKTVSYFAICDTSLDRTRLESILHENHIDNILVFSEDEYAKYLVDSISYQFLIRFDKIDSPINGTILKGRTELFGAVPTYLLKIGCANSVVIRSDQNDLVKHYRYSVLEFKKGTDIFTTVYVPNNYLITSIALNGTAYYVGTQEMDMVGLSVTETDVYQLTGYRAFVIGVTGLTSSAEIFIDACEDFTGRTINKGIVSTIKSNIASSDDETTISVVFNKPFQYLDTRKIKVWAKKDEDSELELVEGMTFIPDSSIYVEKKAVFSGKPMTDEECIITRRSLDMNETVYCTHFDLHTGGAFVNPKPELPPVNDLSKPEFNIPFEPQLTNSVFHWGVTECGRVLISFIGYQNYKYFVVHFEDRAMITNYKVPGRIDDLTIIPVVEDVIFKNTTPEVIVPPEEDKPEDVTPPEETTPDTKPDEDTTDKTEPPVESEDEEETDYEVEVK